MSVNTTPFEIITENGCRFRWESDNTIWQYGLVSGSMDVEDKSVVEVMVVDAEGEPELIATFTSVIAVGKVTEETIVTMPCEKRLTKCPMCGYTE